MLNDIKKILEISKKGIVVVENGKPAYVIIPFDDYDNTDNFSGEQDRTSYLLGNSGSLNNESEIRGDGGQDAVQRIIEKELEFNRESETIAKEMEFEDKFKFDYETESIKKDLKEVRLEDLPF